MGNSFFILSPLNQRLNTIQSPLIKKSTRLLVDICLQMQYHHCYHWKDYVNKETGLVTLHAVKLREEHQPVFLAPLTIGSKPQSVFND